MRRGVVTWSVVGGMAALALACVLWYRVAAPKTPVLVSSRQIWQPGDDANLVNSSQYVVLDEMTQQLHTYGLLTNPVSCDALGNVTWNFQEQFGTGTVYDSETGDNGMLYVLTYDYHLYALDAARNLLWSVAVPWSKSGQQQCTMTQDSEGRSIVFSGENAYSVSREGNVEWSKSIDRLDAYVFPTIDTDGRIYARGLEGQLIALSPTGDELWRKPAGTMPYPGRIKTLPGCGPVFINEDGVLVAYSGEGELLWSYKPRLPFWRQNGIMQDRPDQLLLLCCDAKYEEGKKYHQQLIAIGPDGKRRWAHNCPHMSGLLIMLPNGRLFYTDDYEDWQASRKKRQAPRTPLVSLWRALYPRKHIAVALLAPSGRVEQRLWLTTRANPVLADDGSTDKLYLLSFDGALSCYNMGK